MTLPTKVRLVKAMVFPVVMYGCESWAVKKAKHWKIDAFELWFWRRLLRVPWTVRRSKQSILKEINPEISLDGMMLKEKLQYCGHLMWRVDSLEKTLMLGGIGGSRRGDDRGWDGWMASRTQWTWVCVNSGSWWWTERPGVLRFMGSQIVWHDLATELNWLIGSQIACSTRTHFIRLQWAILYSLLFVFCFLFFVFLYLCLFFSLSEADLFVFQSLFIHSFVHSFKFIQQLRERGWWFLQVLSYTKKCITVLLLSWTHIWVHTYTHTHTHTHTDIIYTQSSNSAPSINSHINRS